MSLKLSLKRVPINIYVEDTDEVIAGDIDKALLPTGFGQSFKFSGRVFIIKNMIWIYDAPVHLRLEVKIMHKGNFKEIKYVRESTETNEA